MTTCCLHCHQSELDIIAVFYSCTTELVRSLSTSELRLFLFLHKEASLGGIRRSIAIAGLWGWLIWMLKQQTVFIQFMRMSHSSVWSKHILNIWPLIISIEREKSPGELDKNEKDINNSKMQCRLSCLLRFSDFYQKPDWEIEAAAVTITITIRLRFNHILNKLA